MGDTELSREIGEVRATLASELGRMKADFSALMMKFEQLKDNYTQMQQTLAQLPELQSRIANALETLNRLQNTLTVHDGRIENNRQAVLAELNHLKDSVLNNIKTEILTLDKNIVERLPHDTIHDSIEDLYNKYNAISSNTESTLRRIVDEKLSELANVKGSVSNVSKDVNDLKIENAKSSVKWSIIIAIGGVLLATLINVVLKPILERSSNMEPKKIEMQRQFEQTVDSSKSRNP